MALIPCLECDHQISDKASACPQCGAPVGPAGNWTQAKAGKISRPLPPVLMLFGVASLVLIFVLPPVGFVMFMFLGLISLMVGKVAVFIGKCPNCEGNITTPQNLRAAPCPLCTKPLISREGRFYEA